MANRHVMAARPVNCPHCESSYDGFLDGCEYKRLEGKARIDDQVNRIVDTPDGLHIYVTNAPLRYEKNHYSSGWTRRSSVYVVDREGYLMWAMRFSHSDKTRTMQLQIPVKSKCRNMQINGQRWICHFHGNSFVSPLRLFCRLRVWARKWAGRCRTRRLLLEQETELPDVLLDLVVRYL